MYPAIGRRALERARNGDIFRRLRREGLNRTLVALGATSLLADISSEMVTSVLPLYLVLHLQQSPLVYGAVDGLYQGGAALARLLGGVVGDRSQRHRDVAAVGYTASAVSRLLLFLAGSHMAAVVGATALDRIGKGLRTAPRDALISLSVPREQVATAFGVHRAMDTTGALLGPLLTFLILAQLPRAYDVVFLVSLVAGLLGVAVLLTFVRRADRAGTAAPSWQVLLDTLRHPWPRRLTLVGALLGLATVGDGLIYLALQRRLQFAEGYLPLLFVATPAVFMLLALPVGRLADRVGRGRAVVAGYGCLLAVYALMLTGPRAMWVLAASIVLLGTYYAATDGVLMALASAGLSKPARATGLGLVATAQGTGRLVASTAFGWVWTRGSLEHAMAFFAATLLGVLVVTWRLLRRADVAQATATLHA